VALANAPSAHLLRVSFMGKAALTELEISGRLTAQ